MVASDIVVALGSIVALIASLYHMLNISLKCIVRFMWSKGHFTILSFPEARRCLKFQAHLREACGSCGAPQHERHVIVALTRYIKPIQGQR